MITAACCQVPSFQKDPPSEPRESTSLPSMKRTEVNGCLIRPQNGVGDYDSSPQIDTLNGNVAEAQKRPKKLQVPATTAGGCTAKSYRKDSHEDNSVHDSLPSSPELEQRGDVDSCPAGDAVLDSATRELIGRFLVDFIANTESRRSDSKALKTMKRVVDGLLEKHRYAYNGMINNLSLGNRADDAGFVSAVARSLFKDGITNWGRIASLVAFGATVCQSFKKNGRENNVEQVAHEISTYLLSEQRDWLVKNNSWDGFVEFFRVSDPETTVRNALIGLAGFAGIGATLALLIR